jgi:hypothetical protein
VPTRSYGHLFALKQALGAFDFCASQLAECDAEIQRAPTLLHAHDGTPAAGKRRSRSRNAPKFEVREHLFQLCGVDLRATIIGIRDAVTAVR